MEWLASGMRRDICILLYGGEYRTQKLKTALQRRYDRRIRPKQFDGAMTALVDGGYVERRVDGIADVVALTDRGERGVETQYAWFHERVGGGSDGSDSDDGGDGDDGVEVESDDAEPDEERIDD